VGVRFQVCFTPLVGVLFTFPSRYWCTIGRQGVFRLGGWSPHVRTGFHVPRPTRGSIGTLRLRGCHPLRPAFPGRSASSRWTTGLLRFRSPLLAESRLMSFPPGTEMFQFPGFASRAYGFGAGYPEGWVAPFGHPRINDRSHLPAAFRSVPRPSSPLGAKASTGRPCHARDRAAAVTTARTPPERRGPGRGRRAAAMTASRAPLITTRTTSRTRTHSRTHTTIPDKPVNEQTGGDGGPAGPRQPHGDLGSASRNRESLGTPHSFGQIHHPSGRRDGGDRIRTDDPLLAKQVLYQLSYAPAATTPRLSAHDGTAAVWAREDLNLRPHAYQACALTN
jgi:hypothetical protein